MEAPDEREREDCPDGTACDYMCDQHENVTPPPGWSRPTFADLDLPTDEPFGWRSPSSWLEEAIERGARAMCEPGTADDPFGFARKPYWLMFRDQAEAAILATGPVIAHRYAAAVESLLHEKNSAPFNAALRLAAAKVRHPDLDASQLSILINRQAALAERSARV